eukprot:2564800-Pyramimonas_sp.AAC.1
MGLWDAPCGLAKSGVAMTIRLDLTIHRYSDDGLARPYTGATILVRLGLTLHRRSKQEQAQTDRDHITHGGLQAHGHRADASARF